MGARRKIALRSGFITLHRDAILHMDDSLPGGVCWTLVKLMALADYETGIVVCSIRGLAIEFKCDRKTVREHLRLLKAAGLIDWIDEATNQNIDGQLAIPGFDWLSGVKDAVGPGGPLSVPAASAGPVGGPVGGPVSGPADILPPAETGPLELQELQDKPFAPPSADAESVREQIRKAITEACGIDPADMTASALGALAKAAKELHEVNATPDEVEARSRHYRAKWPTATLTPSALAKHWATLAGNQTNGKTRSDQLVFMSTEWLKANPHWEEMTP
nr:hypothetical protein [Actinomycetota bacterium]